MLVRLNGAFWLATAERVITTFLQTYLGLYLAGDVIFNAFEFNWYTALGPALGAAVISLIKCVLAAWVNHSGSPSLANEAVVSSGRHAKPE